MKNFLKSVFDFLAITSTEAGVLCLLAAAGATCVGWGIHAQRPQDWELLFRNLPVLCGLGTFLLAFFVYLGCMHDSEKRGLVLCVICSLLIHAAFFLAFADVIVGFRPVQEHEVALNLQPKPPVLVNDYYFGELPGDEVLDADSVVPEALASEDSEAEEKPELSETLNPFQAKLKEDATREELERAAETHEVLELESDARAEEARAMAESIQASEPLNPERGMAAEEAGREQTFVDLQKLGRNVAASGLIGAEGLSTDVSAGTAEILSADAAKREKINLREEALKKKAARSGFSQKLEKNRQNQNASGPDAQKSDALAASSLPKTSSKTGQIPSELAHDGENVVSGAASNWGEAATEKKAGGAGKALGEVRSGLGEERGPASGAASLGVSAKTAPPRGTNRKIAVSDAPKNVKGGQTLGARAGEDENLEALLSGAINGVSDAVLETTAKPEKIAGSNVLDSEKEEILKNVVVFRFEEPQMPESGFQPDSLAPRDWTDSNADGRERDGAEDGELEAFPQPDLTAAAANLLEPGAAFKPQPSLPYRQRMRQDHRQMIEEAGGNPISEQVVEQGLQYLERNQFADGHWSLNFLPNELPEGLDRRQVGFGSIHADTAATGLSLLAYLGAGCTHLDSNDYAQVVNRGLNWLLKNQQPDGSLFREETDAHRYGRIYSHGIATIALCEAYGMTHDSRLQEPAQKAIDFILSAQTPQGGWRYTPEKKDGVWRGESDTSVSGWQAMALVSAKMAGLRVPDSCFEKLDLWVKHAAIDGGSRFCYLPVETPLNAEMEGWKKPSHAMTAEGLLMELYLNYDPKDPKFQEAVDYLMTSLPTVTEAKRDTYYWYYATQVLFHVHDSRWQKWQAALVDALQKSQETGNEYLKGSWDPYAPAPDHWGMLCGRHYVTTMHLLMLEVYYRHLPLFRELTSETAKTEK